MQIAALIAAGLGSALESARAYQALADERSTLAGVLGSTSDAVIMLNDDGIVLLANPAVGPMVGLVAPDTMVGRTLVEVPGHEPLRRLFEEGRARTVELPLADGRTAQASLISEVLPRSRRGDRGHPGHRARTRHHEEHRRESRGPDRRGERRERGKRLRGRPSGVPAGRLISLRSATRIPASHSRDD